MIQQYGFNSRRFTPTTHFTFDKSPRLVYGEKI